MDHENAESDSDRRLNGDGDKQILAPSEEPRENLISTAVKFLQNPKVLSSPLYQKKAFLEKKGLTQEEINIAVQRSGVKETSFDVTPNYSQPPPGYQPGMMTVIPQAPLVPIPPQSGWARAKDLTLTAAIVAGVSYTLYHVFQIYLRPRLFGKSAHEKRLEVLEGQISEIQKSVSESLAEMNRTLANIQMTLNSHQTQAYFSQGEVRGISDLKTEINSLKGLLLNRSQFPPAPAPSPILPSWQRAPVPNLSPAVSKETEAPSSYADAVKAKTTGNLSIGYPATQDQASEGIFKAIVESLESSPAENCSFNSHVQKDRTDEGNEGT